MEIEKHNRNCDRNISNKCVKGTHIELRIFIFIYVIKCRKGIALYEMH